MKVLVFTPTYRNGGLDVLEASLRRQKFKKFEWLVCDELYQHREHVWNEISQRVKFDISILEVDRLLNNKRNLSAAYNKAAEYCVKNGFDVFVSLQDYIWAPEDGLQRFVDVAQQSPNDIITGVTHISMDPFPTKVWNLMGEYTIFEKPYHDKPSRLSWNDVRVSEIYTGFNTGDIIGVEENHWEANWAAVPVDVLKAGVRWDEEYDRGIAYENMDFAKRCKEKLNSQVWLDTGNVAISLPHKEYFQGEREEIEEFSNREFFDNKWSQK